MSDYNITITYKGAEFEFWDGFLSVDIEIDYGSVLRELPMDRTREIYEAMKKYYEKES